MILMLIFSVFILAILVNKSSQEVYNLKNCCFCSLILIACSSAVRVLKISVFFLLTSVVSSEDVVEDDKVVEEPKEEVVETTEEVEKPKKTTRKSTKKAE